MIKDFKAKLARIDDLSPTVKNFIFELEEEVEFKAGQFVNIIFEEEGQRVMKPYSIASAPSQTKEIDLCIKLVPKGKVTPLLFQKELGFEVILKGPLGLFTIGEETKEKLVFIGAGTGVSPLRSMIIDLLQKGEEKEITLILGVRHENEILFKEEFYKLMENYPNFRFVEVVSRPTDTWVGRRGHVQDNFDMIDALNSQFYICGLQAMIDGAKEKLEMMGANSEDIHFERYI